MIFFKKNFLFYSILMAFLIMPFYAFANWQKNADFYIESDYDLYDRDYLQTQFLRMTNKFYIYVDTKWYEDYKYKTEFNDRIYNLVTNFEYNTYPLLTNLFGNEDLPGIDNDSRLVLVLKPLKSGYGGYVRVADHYDQSIKKNSNQGQIIYLNSNLILRTTKEVLNYELAHEFMHLISLKQRPEIETWFAEFFSELAGQLSEKNLNIVTNQRAQALVYSTETNLINWENQDQDYAKVYLLGMYLKEQFNELLFVKILKYIEKNGLDSFQEVFKENNLNFEQIYLNWLITNIANDCSLGNQYCYQCPGLKDFFISGDIYYLSTRPKGFISANDSINAWSNKWKKIEGGQGTIKLKITIPEQTPIKKIPYIIKSNGNQRAIGFMDFTNMKTQEVYINNMGKDNKVVYFIPFIGFAGEQDKTYYYSWQVESVENTKENEQKIIEFLLKQIEELQRQIIILKKQLQINK